MTIISADNFKLDTSVVAAFSEIIEASWPFNVFSAKRDYVMKTNADNIFKYLIKKYPHCQYRVFYGDYLYMWCDSFSIRVRGQFMDRDRANYRYDDQIIFNGVYEEIVSIVNDFDAYFEDVIVEPHHNVQMVTRSPQGDLSKITLPIKVGRKLVPEMYPIIPNGDIGQYIRDFIDSSANVLVMIGDAGLGKSALINEMILQARKPTQIVFDKEVMKMDSLYTSFINESLRDDGGLLVMEDADTILSDRIIENNTNMSRLLNMSDGIVDTSGAKFIFSANLKSKEEIDSALIRPGRCFDVLEFRNLTREEAEIAAKAVGTELFADKSSYTVAGIYNSKANRKEKKNKVGFI